MNTLQQTLEHRANRQRELRELNEELALEQEEAEALEEERRHNAGLRWPR